MADSELRRLKRKHYTARAKTTRFTTLIMESTASAPLENFQYYQDHLRETLDQLLSLDNDIQDFLDDNEYMTDVEVAEEYINSAERALLKAKQEIENRPILTGEKPNCKRMMDWMELLEKLMAKEEMLAKLDGDRKACREEMAASREDMDTSHKEMVAEIEHEMDIKTMVCQEMKARPEEKPTSADRKPEAAQQEEVP
jgi:hypothetical protein